MSSGRTSSNSSSLTRSLHVFDMWWQQSRKSRIIVHSSRAKRRAFFVFPVSSETTAPMFSGPSSMIC
jgi:hypothetical protein